MSTDVEARAGHGAEADVVLRVRDLHVRLGGSHVLQGVDLDVPRTGVTALLGRNGVGKTTTVKAVLGLVPRSGSVQLDGVDITGARTPGIVRRGVGYVPEDREVFGGLTVEENLRLAAGAGGSRASAWPAVVDELFGELRQRRRQRAGTLSGGQQQMVALARVLLHPSRLLLVDEPTKGLAPRLVTEVAVVLERVAASTPVLLVEQDLRVVRRLAQRVVVLDAGRVVHAGPAQALLEDADLTRELLGVAGARQGRGGAPR